MKYKIFGLSQLKNENKYNFLKINVLPETWRHLIFYGVFVKDNWLGSLRRK